MLPDKFEILILTFNSNNITHHFSSGLIHLLHISMICLFKKLTIDRNDENINVYICHLLISFLVEYFKLSTKNWVIVYFDI